MIASDEGAAMAAPETDEMHRVVERLIAERDIGGVLVGYARALDAKSWESLTECFVDDALADYGPFGVVRGLPAIVEQCRDSLDHLGTQHLLGNFSIDVTGPRTARAECYFNARHVDPRRNDAAATFVACGRYVDALVRTDHGWRIIERQLETWLTEGDPSIFGAYARALDV